MPASPAAHDINGPTFAPAILTTAEMIAALPKVSSLPTKHGRRPPPQSSPVSGEEA